MDAAMRIKAERRGVRGGAPEKKVAAEKTLAHNHNTKKADYY